MQTSPSTADQLRQARLRIASLERELQALRASTNVTISVTPTPLLPSISTPDPEAHSSSPPSTPTPGSPLSPPSPPIDDKPSTPILTRAAAAAAAAADPVISPSSPISCPPAVPTTPSPSRHDRKPADKVWKPIAKPIVKPVVKPIAKPSTKPVAKPMAKPVAKPTTKPVAKPIAKPVAKSVTSPGPTSSYSLIEPNVNPAPLQIICPNRSTPVPVTAPVSSAAQPRQPPKRRPPPLSVLKTTTTKKDRPTLVAKCLEPKPGQTRYWTEDEHERFLEAMAEYGEKAYVAISNYVETRTPKQVRTHAQKFQMKMARLARQSLEAGQPIEMPAGMCPVIEVPVGSKSTIVAITAEQSAQLSARSLQGPSGIDLSMVASLPGAQPQSKKRSNKLSNEQAEKEDTDELDKVSPSVSDESSSSLTDSYMHYIRTPAVKEEDMEIDNTFDDKLTETLQGASDGIASTTTDFLISDRSSNESASSEEDDKLEELEKLEDGELPLAPFSNPSENWLLPDSVSLPTV